jgi:HD-like signal output (HDOD) protein
VHPERKTAMNWLSKIKRHTAISGGNFPVLFRDLKIPSLPEAAVRMQKELQTPEPDIAKLTKIISADVNISSRVLRTVNSSLYSLSSPISDLQHAVAMMGLSELNQLALAFAVHDTVAKADSPLFDQDVFWADSLLHALFARELARHLQLPNADEAFTIALLSDIAVPILLTGWSEYYTPVIQRWRREPNRLSQLEQDTFGWEHARAGAWILESWSFPEQITALVSAHNMSLTEIREMELDVTVALPIALASQLPSTARRNPHRLESLAKDLRTHLDPGDRELAGILNRVEEGFGEINALFGLDGDIDTEHFKELRKLMKSRVEAGTP